MRISGSTPIFALSVHADYACGHSGACCTAGWPIPVERPTSERLREAIGGGRLTVSSSAAHGCDEHEGCGGSIGELLVAHPDAPADTPVVAGVDSRGVCRFYERDRRRCAIHRQEGESLLPVACQQFPRVSLLDGRGLFVSLSHYCPTAAAMLFGSEPLRIVQAPAAFGRSFEYDPLDGRAAFPPLLHPNLLLDLQAYDDWERAVVGLFGDDTRTAEEAVCAVMAVTEHVRSWTPSGPSFRELLGAAHEAVGRTTCSTSDLRFDEATNRRHYELLLDSVPEAIRPDVRLDRVAVGFDRSVAAAWPCFAAPVRRYLAARAFGSWLAYQGRGLRTSVLSLAVVLSALRVHAVMECEARGGQLDRDTLVAAIRRTDELLVHLTSRQALADRLSAIEKTTGFDDVAAALGIRAR